MSAHMRGLTVTTIAAVAGIAAGVASNAIVGAEPKSQVALAIVFGTIVVQFPLLHLLGIEYGGLGTKDKVYVAFMTFSLWFVSWGILLSTGA
jgi:predicted aconitase with swiveling domain